MKLKVLIRKIKNPSEYFTFLTDDCNIGEFFDNFFDFFENFEDVSVQFYKYDEIDSK